jgi:hypothetical protein
MLCAVIVAKQTTAPRSLKAHMEKLAKRAEDVELDDWDWTPAYPPNRECFEWPMSGECEDQWYGWVDQCSWDWNDMCWAVAEKWYYNSEIEFTEPTKPDEGCAVNLEEMTEECLEQWDTLWSQCYMEADDGVAYMWTDDCDMVNSFLDAWLVWYDYDFSFLEEDEPMDLKKAHQKMQPKFAALKKMRASNLTAKQSLRATILASDRQIALRAKQEAFKAKISLLALQSAKKMAEDVE